MKAIVLAGGHATRLWPLTRDRAKPLLPLGDKPIIAYVLDQLAEMDVDEVLVSTNAKYADDFRAFLDEEGYDAEVVVEDHETEEAKIGSLGAIIQILEERGDDDYLVLGGDNYTTLDLAEFVAAGRANGGPTIGCYDLDSREDARQFGVVETDGDEITGFVEKPEEPPSTLASTLFYYFPEESMELFDAYVEAHRGSGGDYLDDPGQLMEWAHERYDMYAYPFAGEWHDIGTPTGYLGAMAAVSDGFVRGSVSGSDLGSNVWVMDGAEVEGAVLENCIVFPGATITGAELQGTIVDEEAVVDGVDLDGAVIGGFSTVR